jgi:predicted transcriptional regulator
MRLMHVHADGTDYYAIVHNDDSKALHDFLVTHNPTDYLATFTDYVLKCDFNENMKDFDRLRENYATREAELEASISELDADTKFLTLQLNNLHQQVTEAYKESTEHRRRLIRLLTEEFRKARKSVVEDWREENLSKIEVIKNLRYMLPDLGLAECKWMAEQLGF